mmetsp:Transcript_32259/g.99805  ORF Transcript_32259/g.99805 Transcript_32259/m.99805 type:complete len:329 (-) Transcript_32259:17-1003(-)
MWARALLSLSCVAHGFVRLPRPLAVARTRATTARRAGAHDAYLEAACEAATAAGALIRDASADARTVEKSKANAKDLLTKTDLACQEKAASILLDRIPGSSLLGEEDVAPGTDAAKRAAESAFAGTDACVWALDPIDGTANFVDGLPLSTISVGAVACDGDAPRVVAGVVYDPHRDELFGAVEGGGAWVSERGGARRPLTASSNQLEDAIIYAGAPPTLRALAPSLRGIAAVAPRARTMRLLGSAALMLAYVAAGRGAAYFECDLAAWDTSAGCLLVAEAGGVVTDASGNPYTPLTRQIVAAGPGCHAELLELVDSVGGARLDDEAAG